MLSMVFVAQFILSGTRYMTTSNHDDVCLQFSVFFIKNQLKIMSFVALVQYLCYVTVTVVPDETTCALRFKIFHHF